MFLLVLLCKLAGLFAAHKLRNSSQFFSQWAVSTSLCASGSLFDACLYWASPWAHREFTLPQSVRSLCSQTQKYTSLCSSNSSPLLLTQLWLPHLYILQSKQRGFTFFMHKRLLCYLLPLCYAEIQKLYSPSILLCLLKFREGREKDRWEQMEKKKE